MNNWIYFTGDTIGIVLRRVGMGHIDCLLSSGLPVGFFSNLTVEQTVLRSFQEVDSGIRDYKGLQSLNPWYTSAEDGSRHGIRSKVALFQVERDVATQFDAEWEKTIRNTPSYILTSSNCATVAADVFARCGMLRQRQRRQIVPAVLYDHVLRDNRSIATEHIGYMDLISRGASGLALRVTTDLTILTAEKRPRP